MFPALLGSVSRQPVVALIAAGAICVIYFSFSVWHVTLSRAGVRFHRLVGTPKFLPWGEIVSVSEAPRWELIFHGWLLVPTRRSTRTSTGGFAAGLVGKVNLPHWLTIRRSLLICMGNYAIVVLTVLALQSDYFKSDAPLLVRVLFYPFAIFTTFVFLPALAGVIIGLEELRSKATKVASAVAILGNLALMVAYVIAVGIFWPVLMSV